jgi:hypothetical protein
VASGPGQRFAAGLADDDDTGGHVPDSRPAKGSEAQYPRRHKTDFVDYAARCPDLTYLTAQLFAHLKLAAERAGKRYHTASRFSSAIVGMDWLIVHKGAVPGAGVQHLTAGLEGRWHEQRTHHRHTLVEDAH